MHQMHRAQSASRMSFSITRCDHSIWWDTR